MGKSYQHLEDAKKVQKTKPGSMVVVNDDGTFEVKIPQKPEIQEAKQMPTQAEMIKMLEDQGLTDASKDEIHLEVEEIVKKQIENIRMAERDKVYARHIDKKVEVGTQEDLAFLEKIKKAPPVTMSITIQRNSKGESMEHRRPIIGKNKMPALNPRTKGVLLENYIPGSINGHPFEISLGPEFGTMGQQAVSITVPLPLGEIIANARRTTFLDPRTNYKTVFYPPSLRVEQFPQIQNDMFGPQSQFMVGVQSMFSSAA